MVTATEGRGRGRPRNFQIDEALDAALELFWKNGYRVTTTRDLENELGLKASSLYNAFGSKEALLLAAIDRYEKSTTSRLVEPLEVSADGARALDRFFRDLGHWITHEGRRGCMLVNLMGEDGGQTPVIAKRVRAYRERLRRALASALARADGSGATRETVRDRAELLMCQVFGLNIAARGGAGAAELRRMLSAIRAQLRSFDFGRNIDSKTSKRKES